MIGSADEASAYPATMVLDKYPMSKGTFVGEATEDQVEKLISLGYCVLFTVRMIGVDPLFGYEHYISISRCTEIDPEAIVNNGRVVSADYLQITITEQDWDIIKKVYDWDHVHTKFYSLRYYRSSYLPRPLILAILKLFGNKTSLKGVEGKETEYMVSKNMINATYGMTVTNIVRDLYEYSLTDEWIKSKANVEQQLQDYNKSYNRFLFYAWGVWVTAYARHNLWSAILEFGEDYVYADTDSIKGLNFEKHKNYFILYNAGIQAKINRVCRFWHIDPNLYHPKTKDGKIKTIGIWEFEDPYIQFKTLGAKRYMYEYEDGKLSFTMSGVNKSYGVPYLLHAYSNKTSEEDYELFKLAYSDNPSLRDESKKAMKKVLEMRKSGELDYTGVFEAFDNGLYFPPEATGKQTLTYKDNGGVFKCYDFMGQPALVMEKSFIHMEPQDYTLSQSDAYISFLKDYEDGSI